MRIARGSSLLAFGLSFFCTFTTASTVDVNATAHLAVPGDFNGDGLTDALYQPLDGSQAAGIFFRDSAGNLSIPGQVWDAKYLGFDWTTGASVLHTADFRGLGRADILLQAVKTGGKSALLFATPDGQFLNIGQTLPDSTLGFDWSADSHLLYTGRFDGGPQSEVLLQSVSSGGLNGIVHPDPEGHLTQLVETWPDNFLGIPWDTSAASLYVGDFNGDGQDDLLVQMNHPGPTAQGYFLLLADPAGKFSTIKQSWGVGAFGADWSPATHGLSVETIDGVTSLVLTSTTGGSNYVFQANAQGTFSKAAAKWKGPQTATQALHAQSKASAGTSVVVPRPTGNTVTPKPIVHAMASQQDVPVSNGNSPTPATATGELSGSGGVSGGSGSYSIAIPVPPGIAGMQPALSLNYSSKGGNGDLGMGWSLGGLSAIHRCPSTQAQDGQSVGVNYSSSDRLCLDGQHLMKMSGTYGKDGAVYRTELDSGVQVVESGAISSPSSSFEVDYQDGRKAFYGNGSDGFGLTDTVVIAQGATAPLVWDIGQEEDASGNNIIYSYKSFGLGETHIQFISYTGTSAPGTGVVSSDGNRTIVFKWEVRNDGSASYLAGGLTQESQILTSISAESNGMLRQYGLSYGQSGATGRSLLQNVQECGFDSSGTQYCLPATNFTWQNGLSFSAPQSLPLPDPQGGPANGSAIAQAQVQVDKDYYGNGLKALYYAAPGVDQELYWTDGTPPVDLSNPSTGVCDGLPGAGSGDISEDFNDDGKAEVACNKNNFLTISSIASGVVTNSYVTPIATVKKVNNVNYPIQLTFGDFTGGGLVDVLTSGPLLDSTTPVPLYLHANQGVAGGEPQFQSEAETEGNSNNLIYSLLVSNSLPGNPYGIPVSESLTHAGDLDGDGIPDLFVGPPSTQTLAPYKIMFMGPQASSVSVVAFAQLGLPDLNSSSSPTFWKFMDINGDGLQDFVFVGSGNTWEYQLNLGNRKFAQAVDTGVAVAASEMYEDAVAADIDNDGSQELLEPDVNQRVAKLCIYPNDQSGNAPDCETGAGSDRNIYKWNIIKFVPWVNGSGQVNYLPTLWGPADAIEAPLDLLQTGDVDGNGLTAVFADYSPYYQLSEYQPAIAASGYNAVRNTAGAPDLMTSATSGLQRVSAWQYQSLRDLWRDTVPGSGTVSFYNAGYGGSGCQPTANPDPSYYCFATSMYVVSDYQQSDGVGGMREYHYGYENAVYNSQGRGFQGFQVIKEFDLAANTVTTTTFRQDFPFSGKPLEQSVKTIPFFGSKPLTDVSYTWQSAEPVGAACLRVTGSPVYWVQPVSTTATTYDLNTKAQVSQTITNYIPPVNQGPGYDANGNSLYTDSTVTDATGTYETTTTLSYQAPDCTDWWTNWVSTKAVTSTVTYSDSISAGVSGSITRNANYTPTSLRKLHEEQDDQGTTFEKDTTYGYDGYGNVKSVTVSSPDAQPSNTYGALSNGQDYGFLSRTTNTTYVADGFSNGYFVAQVSDPLGHTTTFDSYDIATGQPTSIHDANGVASTYGYDAFGRKIMETDGPMPEIDTSYTAPDATPFSAPGLAAYAVNALQAGYPRRSVYYDLNGKPLRDAKDSDRIYAPVFIDTAYDALGRVTSTTQPYVNGFPRSINTVTGYDFFNRPGQKTDAAGVVTGYTYAGLTTTVTTTPGDNSFGGASDRVDVETRNSLGKLVTVENAQGSGDPTTDGTTQFRYDAQGNPALIVDAKGNQTIAAYNLLGQKTQVADPDQGTSTYAYDVLGEMLQQTDAKGQVTMQTYDVLGRLTTRTQTETQPAATAIWCYDGQSLDPTNPTAGCTGTAGAHAIGKLSAVGQSDLYSETYGFDGASRPIRVTTNLQGGTSSYQTNTSYDQYGRVGTTTYPGSFPDTQPTASIAIGSQTSAVTVQLDNTSNSATLQVTGTTAVFSTVFNTVYSWSVSCNVDSQNGPSGAPPCGTLGSPNAPTTAFTAQDVGTYTLTLTVSDGFLKTTSNSITVTVLPGQPGRPGVSSDYSDPHTSLDGKLWVSWGSGAGATYYNLYQSSDDGAHFTKLPTPYTTTPVFFSGMGSYSTDYDYEYESQACDNVAGTAFCSPISTPSADTIVTFLTDPPTNIAAQSTSYADGTFDVTWTKPDLGVVTRYNVNLLEYDPDDHLYDYNDGITCTASGGATTCRGSGENGTKYFVQVQACNVSVCTSFYPLNPPYSGARVVLPPINLHLSPNPTSSGNYTLSWGVPVSVNSYTGFNVYESFNNGAYKYLGKVTTTSEAFTGKANGSYRYMLTGCIQECGGGNSTTTTETVAVPPGTASIATSAAQVPLDGHYTISWGATGPATSWTLEEATLLKSGWSGWGVAYSGSATSQNNPDAITGSYEYRAQGCNSVGCTAWSSAVTVQVASAGGGSSSGGGGTCPPTCQQVVHKPVIGASAAGGDLSAAESMQDSAALSGTTAHIQHQSVIAATARDGHLSIGEGTRVTGKLSGAGNGPLTFVIISQPGHGKATLANPATGAFDYVPAKGYVGADYFTFHVTDANGTSKAATESITVAAPVGAIALPAIAGPEMDLAGLEGSADAVGPSFDTTPSRLSGVELKAVGTAQKLADSADSNPTPVSAGHRAFAHLHPKFALPVYAAYAHAHVVPATGTQVMARLQVAYGYTDTGYLSSLSNPLSPSGQGAFWTLGVLSPDGEVKTATLGNGVSVLNQYDPVGRIAHIQTSNGSGIVQDNTYTWYNVGNLETRQWQGTSGPQETFSYDMLNRLSSASLVGTSNGGATVTYAYDVLGNIVCKSDVLISGTCSPGTVSHTYGGQPNAGPHAVTAVAGTVNGIANPGYQYDQDGNVFNRAGTNVQWNSLNLPTCIDATGGTCTGGAGSSSFSYAPDKHRYQQTAVDNTTGISETTVYVGNVEFLTSGATPSSTAARHMLSAYGENILSLNIGDPNCLGVQNVCFDYTHSDHLGGVDAVTDEGGNIVGGTSFGYEAFGARRDPVTGGAPTASQVQADRSLTHRGFTKHEMLDNVGLIHMNGRVYDPALGRFLSVDPVYQAPTNMQSLNPYSYVMNNPLSLTDPSGYEAGGGTAPCGGSDKCPDKNSGSTTATGTVTGKVTFTPTGSHVAQSFTVTASVSITTASGNNDNGQENQGQGAGSTIATSQSQGGGAARSTAGDAANVNSKSGAPPSSTVEVTGTDASNTTGDIHTQKVDINMGVSDRNVAGGYDSADAAAIAQYKAYDPEYQQSKKDGNELTGLVVGTNGRFFFTNMASVPAQFTATEHLMGIRQEDIAGYTHTHPDATTFNGLDYAQPASSHVPFYERNSAGNVYKWAPAGAVRYQNYVRQMMQSGSAMPHETEIANPAHWGITNICPGGGSCVP